MKNRCFHQEASTVCRLTSITFGVAVLGLMLFSVSLATAQDKQNERGDIRPLGTQSLLPADHRALRLHGFGEDQPVLEMDDALAILTRKYTLTRQAVEHYLSLGKNHGRRTANVPVPLFDLTLQVDSDNLGYTMFDTETHAGEITFGPYIHNWRSARQTFNGHYGLRLQVPW